jgi:hypothetical protein
VPPSTRFKAIKLIPAISIALSGCAAHDSHGETPPGATGESGDAGAASVLDSATAGATGGGPSDGAPTSTPTFTVELITEQHRYVPGLMFGGWGPHLGHMAAVGTDLYWVDDLCQQNVPRDCDVNVDRRLGYFLRTSAGWTRVATLGLPSGVQQNTGTVSLGGRLHSYGIDTAQHRVVDCWFDPATKHGACNDLPFPLAVGTNYVGAAVSPEGYRVVWWTTVHDGGGGSFSYGVDFGGGWNGPRTGAIGGYNDCGYVSVGFHGSPTKVTWFGQVVTGLAPAWSFSTLTGQSDLTNAVGWANTLVAPQSDAVFSTDDLLIDPATGDAHLMARLGSGGAAYYHRPAGGAFGPVTFSEANTYRARLMAAGGKAYLVDSANGGLHVRAVPLAAGPLDFAHAQVADVALPAELGTVDAIYIESSIYQSAPVAGVDFAVVGSGKQNEAWAVHIDGL